MAFHFLKPAGFQFKAGQSMNVALIDPPETDAKGNSRACSIVSAPSEDTLAIATRLRDIAFKRVLRTMPEGAKLQLRGPAGQFTLDDGGTGPAVFLAGGIGITPFVSMLRQAAHDGLARKLYLFYSNRRPEDAAFLGELQQFQVHSLPGSHHSGIEIAYVGGRLIRGAFGFQWALFPGETMRFCNDHDPLPLLDRLRSHYGDKLELRCSSGRRCNRPHQVRTRAGSTLIRDKAAARNAPVAIRPTGAAL